MDSIFNKLLFDKTRISQHGELAAAAAAATAAVARTSTGRKEERIQTPMAVLYGIKFALNLCVSENDGLQISATTICPSSRTNHAQLPPVMGYGYIWIFSDFRFRGGGLRGLQSWGL